MPSAEWFLGYLIEFDFVSDRFNAWIIQYCMEMEIASGRRTCPICRKPKKAMSSVLPISATLERLIRENHKHTHRHIYYKQSIKRRKIELCSSEDEKDENNVGRCTTHRKNYLYFHCMNHSKNICNECHINTKD